MLLATEFDVLFHEPALLAQCRSAAVRVMSATATVTGITVAVPGADFTSGDPYAAAGLAAFFPASAAQAGVVAVTSATELMVSLASSALDGDSGPWIAPGISGDVTVELYAFPQLRVASEQVLAALGADAADVVAPATLRRACCHAALAAIFRSMAAFDRTSYTVGETYQTTLTPNAGWEKLAEVHDAAYQASLRVAKVSLDRNGDGIADFKGSAARPRVLRG